MEHLNTQNIARYLKRELAPTERLEISDHLAVCPECRQRIQQARTEAPVVSTSRIGMSEPLTPEDEHLSHEEIVEYIEGRCPPALRELVEGHISDCTRCREEVREMRAFRATLSTYPDMPLAPTPPPTWQERLRTTLRLPALRTGLQLGGAALVGACVMFLLIGKQPVAPAPPDNALALQQARNEVKQARQAQALAAAELAKEREAHTSTKRLMADVTQQRDTWKKKADQLAAARPHAGAMVTDTAGQLALVIPVGGAERQALATHHLVLPTERLADLQSTHLQMGDHEAAPAVTLLNPMGTFVASLRPTLRWKPFLNAARYEVRVVDVESNTLKAHGVLQRLNEKRWSVSSALPTEGESPAKPGIALQGTEWTLPAQSALEAGRTYRWTVTAYDAAGTVLAQPSAHQEARFRTLDTQAQQEIEGKRALYASAPLLLGVVYARHGVLSEAETAFRQALATDPNNNAARQWLAQIRKKTVRQP